ncbi:ComEC/Rec2 family competence protein [Bifidobacterium catenulatum]|uniref:Competence protein n=1 Tax=Bifidobacterium catenulatum PV20-2 TaxID=1447716 RepID=A0A0A7I6V8_9BIFI|nr:ComEC/Rec2 family competence protein [Bifidobacterium catenulatum]AIZ14564.1 competence protein [Bifidobacterium catenulatum PV20-2]
MRGNTYEWRDREQGSGDWRLLPATLCGWAASLATHAVFDYCVEQEGRLGVLPLVLVLTVPLLALLGLPFMRSPILRLPVGMRRAVAAWHFSIIVCVVAAMACASSALTYDVLQWRDAASYAARKGESDVVALIRTTSPAVNSNRRTNDCQIDATISTITASRVTQPSMMRVRVYADRPDCGTLKQGGEYRMRGTLAISQYGAMPLWLTDIASVECIRASNPALRVIDMMQQAFFEQTSRLSDQGKVLVPGLTLGILGQDYIPSDSGNGKTGTGIDSTYANLLENAFQRSGILHLMAVSGGHLAVVATIVRAACSFLLLPRRVTAIVIGMSYIMLAMCVFPSDSVSRALLMGLAGVGFLLLGRRTQALAALNWTTLGMLMANPHMSRSFGFALSCAAVLGIVLFANPLSAWLTPIMPSFIAQTMAMTVAAQLFTLPIQVLIEPELPVYSIPANLVVAPFVGFSTLAGLASLAISWILPNMGFMLANLASWGTAVMELMALNLGSGEHATIPWAGGAGGALLIIIVEIVGYMTARLAGTLFTHITTPEPNLPGRRLMRNPVERAKAWGERTHNALKTMKWNE